MATASKNRSAWPWRQAAPRPREGGLARAQDVRPRAGTGGRGTRRLRAVLVGVLALALAACGSKITEQNYGRIASGMTQQEVEAILGAPTDSRTLAIGSLSGTLATWRGKDGRAISVQFLNGKVMGKEFVKPGGQAAG